MSGLLTVTPLHLPPVSDKCGTNYHFSSFFSGLLFTPKLIWFSLFWHVHFIALIPKLHSCSISFLGPPVSFISYSLHYLCIICKQACVPLGSIYHIMYVIQNIMDADSKPCGSPLITFPHPDIIGCYPYLSILQEISSYPEGFTSILMCAPVSTLVSYGALC